MNKTFNILMVGVGGQGIILGSDIVAQAAMQAGFDAKKSEIHGMSQRGGSVFSHIRFGQKVYSPVIPEGEADILIALEEMEIMRWLNYASPETLIIVAGTRILPENTGQYPEGIIDELKNRFKQVKVLEPDQLIKLIGKPKYLNVALIGYLSNFISIPEHAWQEAIRAEVPPETYTENWQAFISGKQVAVRDF